MSDLNWCTFCDNAINVHSNSLYCSEECLRADALNHHPLLGYDYSELKDFPRSSSSPTLSAYTTSSSSSTASLSSPILSPVLSFKDFVPNLNLNIDQQRDDSIYQHIYQQKQSMNKPACIKFSPAYLSSWKLN